MSKKRRDGPSIGKSVSIDLHGMTAKEAIATLEGTLDRALLADASQIEIVHGLGTGKLKEAVHSYLKASRHVKNFRISINNPGMTIAYL